MDDDDDFGLGDTGDLAAEHDDEFGVEPKTNAGPGDDSLFSGDDDDFGLGAEDGGLGDPGDVPAPRLAPAGRPPPPPRRESGGGLFGDESEEGGDDDLGLSGGDEFGGNIEIDDGPGPIARMPPPRAADFTNPAGRPPPPPRRESGGGLFGDESEEGGDDDLGLSGGDEFGGDIEIDNGPGPIARMPPPRAADFTNPSVSLDANDSELADLLGPQPEDARRPPSLPPPRPVQTISAPPPPDPTADYGLGDEDSELAELLGEGAPAARLPAPLPPVSSSPPPPPTRRISFQEPVAAPLQPPGGGAYRGARGPPPPPDDDFGDDVVDDSGEGFGLSEEADREVAARAARRGGAHDDDNDDFGSEDGYGLGEFGERAPSRQGNPPAFQRIPSQNYGPIDDPSDSPVSRDARAQQRRGGRPPARRLVGASSEASGLYGEDGAGEDDEYGDEFDGSGLGGGGAAFRRIPAPRPGRAGPGRSPGASGGDPYEDDYYEDDEEDVFADDVSWDGEIRASHVAMRPGARPGSAGHPRSRGPHATGARRRPQSAMAPRERQAAMLEEMQSRHPSTWDIREVATWLEFIGMGQYRAKFVHNSVDGALLLTLTEPELARDLRILPLGHRRALLGALEALKAQAEELEKSGNVRGKSAMPRNEAERLAEIQRRQEERPGARRPSSAGANVIPPEPFLGPAQGKTTVYEQRAKLLHQLDKAKHRAAQHAAIIEQLSGNKALTDAQVAELRGKLKDLESKHREEFSPTRRPGMTAPLAPGGLNGNSGHKGAAAFEAAEYGADAAVPWLPVGRGTRAVKEHPERFARTGEDPDLDLTFRPRILKVSEVPSGQVRDIVAKALGSRTPFWQRMDFEFEKMRKDREAKEEARRKRRERMGVVKRGGGEGEEDDKVKSKYWNNFWVPGSQKNSSYHKHYKKGSENAELAQYRSFTKDKTRLSRWFKKFVDDDESTEGDVALERLINRMIKALVKTKDQMEMDFGDSFDTRIRRYFEERGYKFATSTSNTIMVRARGTRPPAPPGRDITLYDFEEVEQYYPDYLKKKIQTAQDDEGGGDEEETRMVPKRTTWKRLIEMYYMERQKKIRAAVAMVKMSQFVQRHGAKFPPERDRDQKTKDAWVPNSRGGALHQLDGRDRTFNTLGQDNISKHANLGKALGPPKLMTPLELIRQQEALEAKADQLFAQMGWPHSLAEPPAPPPPRLPPQEPMGLDGELGREGFGGPDPRPDDGFGMDGRGGDGGGLGGEGDNPQGYGGFGLQGDSGHDQRADPEDHGLTAEAGAGGEGGFGGEDGGDGQQRPRLRRHSSARSAPPPPPPEPQAPWMDFYQTLDTMLDRAMELREMNDDYIELWRRAYERGYGYEELPASEPTVRDLDWRNDPLIGLQFDAMDLELERLLQEREKERRKWERRAARMRREGYRERDIVRTLGPEPEVPQPQDVEQQLPNYLFRNVALLSRIKLKDLARLRDKLTGTKKKMAVYRALCSQMFVDEMRDWERYREETVRKIFESYQRRGPKPIPEEQRKELVSRMMEDNEEREMRLEKARAERLAQEESNYIPWNELPRRVRSPGHVHLGSRPTSPERQPHQRYPFPHNPDRKPLAKDTIINRDNWVFGCSTPKSMWGPMGPLRKRGPEYQPLHLRAPSPAGAARHGRSLLDTFTQRDPQGGRSERLLKRAAARQERARPWAEGDGQTSPERQRPPSAGGAASTYSRYSAATPSPPRTTPSMGVSSGGGGPAPSTPASRTTPGRRVSGGGAAAPPSTATGRTAAARGERAAGTAAPAGAKQRPTSARPASPAPSGGRGRPASPARYPAGPAISPRRRNDRLGYKRSPSPVRASVRSSGGSATFLGRDSLGGAGGGGDAGGGGGAAYRRGQSGLMDGDTTSASVSPDRPGAGRQAQDDDPGGGEPHRYTRRGGGLADTDSSPSPPPRRPQPPPEPPVGPGPGAGSRRSSHASGASGPVGPGRGRGPGADTGAGFQATPPPGPGLAQPRRPSGASTPRQGLSQQASAASGIGMAPGPGPRGPDSGLAGRRLGDQTPLAGGSGTGSGSASGGISAGPGSRRPSTPQGGPPLEPQLSASSRLSVGSGRGAGAAGGPGSGGRGSGTGSGGFGGAGGGGGGSTSGASGFTGPPRSPLSRSPVAASPPSQSPPSQSPPQSPPPPAPQPRQLLQPQSAYGEDEDGGGGGEEGYDGLEDFEADGDEYDDGDVGGGDLDLGDADDGGEVDFGQEDGEEEF